MIRNCLFVCPALLSALSLSLSLRAVVNGKWQNEMKHKYYVYATRVGVNANAIHVGNAKVRAE